MRIASDQAISATQGLTEASVSPSPLLLRDKLFCLYLSIPGALITLLVALNPTGAPPFSPFHDLFDAGGMFLASWLAFFLPAALLLTQRKKIRFVGLFVGMVIFSTAFITVAGLACHRDYYTLYFQMILIYYVIYLLRVDFFSSSYFPYIEFLRKLYVFSLILFFTVLLWTMWMGYAIVSRSEPRWMESIFFNVYNTILITIMLFLTLGLRVKFFKNLILAPESISFNGQELAENLSERHATMLRLFLAHRTGQLNCEFFSRQLPTDNPPHCRQCAESNWAPTKCAAYKGLKNRVLELKDRLELLQIGTILAAHDNSRRIKQEGWTIKLFSDVRCVIKH